MALTVNDRLRMRRALLRVWDRSSPITFTKADLDAAFDATDAWLDSTDAKLVGISNVQSWVTALTAASSAVNVGTNATEKALLFSVVTLARFNGIERLK